MKIKALLFVIFTIFLFALGVLVTTLFNASPVTPDAVAMLYVSLYLALFGLIFFFILINICLLTKVTPGPVTLKTICRLTLIIDLLLVALLALKAYNVLNWPTSIILALVALIIGVIFKRRSKS